MLKKQVFAIAAVLSCASGNSYAQSVDVTGVINPAFVVGSDTFSTMSFTSEEFVGSDGKPKGLGKTIRVGTITASGGLANVSIQKTDGYLKKYGTASCNGASQNCVRYTATATWTASSTVSATVELDNSQNPKVSTEAATGPGPLRLTIIPNNDSNILSNGTFSDIIVLKIGDSL